MIRPTHGLGARGKGGTLSMNLENVGGRILVMDEKNKHKERMRSIKPVISIAPPWSHADHTPGIAPKKKAGRPMSAKHHTHHQMDGAGRPSSTQHPHPPAAVAEPQGFDMTSLTDTQQGTVRDMVRLLCGLCNEDSRGLLEHMYRDSEERKLLSAYTGIFPSLDHAEGPEADEQK
jgi:hypothetical protein